MKLFSSFTLKIMAIIFMAMDHIYTYLGGPLGGAVPIWFGYLGKLAAPIFFYLIVEGFYHTKSRLKYMQRLFGMGLLMIGVDLFLGIHNNIFLSLGLGVAMLCSIEYAKVHEKASKGVIFGVLAAVLFGGLSIFTEASIYGFAMILIFYFLRDKRVLICIVYAAISLFGLVPVIGPNLMEAAFLWDYQWMMVFGLIPILMYNGKLGVSNKFVKNMFYWFYPIHLIVIVGLAKVLG
ncbi:MAG: TraX family protein [Clostridium sp.]